MADKPTNSHKPQSLDEIVSQSAVVIAEQIRNAASWAKSEMDLQVEVAGFLKDFARQAKIALEGHHNVTVATGRPDSVYGSVIVEYKGPGTLSANKEAAPNKAVIEQLKRRFYDLNREEHRRVAHRLPYQSAPTQGTRRSSSVERITPVADTKAEDRAARGRRGGS